MPSVLFSLRPVFDVEDDAVAPGGERPGDHLLCRADIGHTAAADLPAGTSSGCVRMVSAERDVEVFGPELPEALDANYTGYSAVTSSNGPVFSEETTTQTTYVYANDNGKFYHNLDCEYVQWYSKKYALAVAYYNGYTPCEKCMPPEYTPGMGT